MLWACLLRSGGWVALFRVRLLVFAFLGVGAGLLGVVGQCGPAAPVPLAWLVLTRPCGRCWRVLGAACPMGGGLPGRGGTIMSRPLQRGVRCPAAAWRGREKVGEGALMVR